LPLRPNIKIATSYTGDTLSQGPIANAPASWSVRKAPLSNVGWLKPPKKHPPINKHCNAAPSPKGDLSHLGSGEGDAAASRGPAEPNERERVSPRWDEGGPPLSAANKFHSLTPEANVM
jgi:hypothetical protein